MFLKKEKALVPESLLILYNMEDKRNGRSRIDPIKILPVNNRGICKQNASSGFIFNFYLLNVYGNFCAMFLYMSSHLIFTVSL